MRFGYGTQECPHSPILRISPQDSRNSERCSTIRLKSLLRSNLYLLKEEFGSVADCNSTRVSHITIAPMFLLVLCCVCVCWLFRVSVALLHFSIGTEIPVQIIRTYHWNAPFLKSVAWLAFTFRVLLEGLVWLVLYLTIAELNKADPEALALW